ncbi:tannase/feruloyl esterase family alpha/beta hydrolase [Altericroceibacterium endophyticum]|uniref:Tannase/feruloyl esterase family alpha/beta hydrolase n=1 Tax=Altericroceibacterium endophyticum TaxID=1808508 RepID=A0A6I4T2R4_9SPHN|nr:tannase/feruloyl esterase family alpha/beta hydrolase [Altericroceibacterium endophyticum]MXO64280.1 tannase/feruloyl esterase family alpha/beta hydrolase [Altericroceibacterium endophyticum]
MRFSFLAMPMAALALSSCAATYDDNTNAPESGTAAFAASDSGNCAAVTPAMLGAEEAQTRWVPASGDLPSFCEVTALLSPAEGSQIGVVYRLPENWNGKILGLGGGGWAGNLQLGSASQGLSRGYATAQTDGGHPGTNPWDLSWISDPAAITDFAYRAIHTMSVSGKSLVDAYYGTPHRRAYFQGCSTGGRMALMEAQRFPQDFDGIISGAPVYTLQVQSSAIFRNNLFARPGAALSSADLALAQNAALTACDAKDGLKDGLINDPARCDWNPASLICKAGQSENCLQPAQVQSLQTAYDGIRADDGSWVMFPMMRGGETGWSVFNATDGSGMDATGGGGMVSLAPLLFGHKFDYTQMTGKDVLQARRSAFAEAYEADDPNLSGFFSKGGKLLLWHGQNDPGPSPVGTADYYRAAFLANPEAGQQMRYFELPGVEHCAGGPGPDSVDLLAALDQWVEDGSAPAFLTATKADAPLRRKICPYPLVAQYSGGETNDLNNWSCSKSPE